MGNAKSGDDVAAGGLGAHAGLFSILAIVLSNLIPLWGVLFRGWDVFAIMLLFWLENLVIGVFNACRMITVPPYTAGVTFYKFFLIPFFVFHYGVFLLAHGLFIFALFCPEFFEKGDALAVNDHLSLSQFSTLLRAFVPPAIPVALAAMVVSHGVSFVSNFLMQGECRLTSVDALMTAPYRRVIVLHITLIAAAFIVVGIGEPKLVIAAFVILKIVMDVMGHKAERKRYAKARTNLSKGAVTPGPSAA